MASNTDPAKPPARATKRKDAAAAAAARPRRAYLPAAERRRSIIAAAQEVFARTNFQGARTRDIAKAAAVNQATIFQHFESKEKLFEAAVIEPLIEAMKGMHERLLAYEAARSTDELARLAEASTERHMREMARIFPLLTAALFSDLELGRKLYSEHVAPLISERGLVLAGLTREGIDPEFVGLANFGMLLAVAMDRFFRDRSEDLSALAAQFNRLSTGGFAREMGDPNQT
ncbi:MAG: TetR/AcrR family transcriptional regulator [Novosphingobium sp.]|nr:TetR/AcrR family transcriptional regulator [Novosphingobium sp.]